MSDEDYRRGYREGFKDGFFAGKGTTGINPYPSVRASGCSVCGMGADGMPTGYACPRLDCPTKVVCFR